MVPAGPSHNMMPLLASAALMSSPFAKSFAFLASARAAICSLTSASVSLALHAHLSAAAHAVRSIMDEMCRALDTNRKLHSCRLVAQHHTGTQGSKTRSYLTSARRCMAARCSTGEPVQSPSRDSTSCMPKDQPATRSSRRLFLRPCIDTTLTPLTAGMLTMTASNSQFRP